VRPRKLTYREKNDLEALPETIAALETEQAELMSRVNEPEFFRLPHAQTEAALERLNEVNADLEQSYARWDELDSLASKSHDKTP